MVLHDRMKNAKIAEDLFVYFLEKEFKDVAITISIRDTETVFSIRLFKKNDSVIEHFQNQLCCSRDYTLEEYGWEVMIENDSEFELDHLAYQLDYYNVHPTENGYLIEMVRKK